MDNYAAHKHPKVKAWLAAKAQIQIHFTSGSWLNLVEVWFGIIERQAIHRGTFSSVRDLMIKIYATVQPGGSDSSSPPSPHPHPWCCACGCDPVGSGARRLSLVSYRALHAVAGCRCLSCTSGTKRPCWSTGSGFY
jgi:hypothetical protein